MRIGVETGGLGSGAFDGGAGEMNTAADAVVSVLAGLEGAAGDPALATAISDLAKDMSSADRSAALTITSLGKAVGNAGAMYDLTEHKIAGAAHPR